MTVYSYYPIDILRYVFHDRTQNFCNISYFSFTPAPFKRAASGNTSVAIVFVDGNVGRGSIQYSNAGTSFNTSSDYRLKENVTNISDGITRIKQLTPRRFNWISDETNTLQDGFIAHEVSSIVPEAISGEKDAVDSNN